MALARVKNWVAEVLTYSDLNAEFNSILTNVESLICPITFNLTFTDATYDIGASGATRPRDLFLSRNAKIGGTLTVDGASTLTGEVQVGGGYGATGVTITAAGAISANGLITVGAGGINLTSASGTTYVIDTWTPTGNGVSLTVNSATYTRIGDRVFANFDLTWPATADAGAAQISGLPFAAGAANQGCAIMSTNRATFISALVVSGQGRIDLYANGILSNANVSTERFIGTAVYFM